MVACKVGFSRDEELEFLLIVVVVGRDVSPFDRLDGPKHQLPPAVMCCGFRYMELALYVYQVSASIKSMQDAIFAFGDKMSNTRRNSVSIPPREVVGHESFGHHFDSQVASGRRVLRAVNDEAYCW